MRRLAFVLAMFAAACGVNGDEEFPVTTQGGPAPDNGAGSAATVTGRVCVVTDPRFLAQCVDTGADNLTVTLATPTTNGVVTTTTMTTANGSFVINSPTATAATGPTVFTITGPNIISSSQVLTTTSNIPVISQTLFDQIAAANGIALNETTGTGSIIATVTRGGTPVSGVQVAATPTSAFGPFFDGTSPTGFTLNGTGVQGVSLLSGFHSGPVNLTFTDPALASETTVGGVQVIDGGITFVEGNLP
jgi:hypothetical protein